MFNLNFIDFIVTSLQREIRAIIDIVAAAQFVYLRCHEMYINQNIFVMYLLPPN